jgi:hypothetical protein
VRLPLQKSLFERDGWDDALKAWNSCTQSDCLTPVEVGRF